jgi:hypothetical protein
VGARRNGEAAGHPPRGALVSAASTALSTEPLDAPSDRAVELLLETIRRSIDAAKPIGIAAVTNDPKVSALLVLDTGATFERRFMFNQWVWVEVSPVPTTKLAVLRLLEDNGEDGGAARRNLGDRVRFNQALASALRHVSQKLLQEHEARTILAGIRESGEDFTRPMSVAQPSALAERTFTAAAVAADAAIIEFTDLIYDAFERARSDARASGEG